jgi:predicted ATPase
MRTKFGAGDAPVRHSDPAPRIAQFVIATHSPLLLAFPGATVLSLDGGAITEVDYRDTDHYRVTRDFLESPERFFRHLFDGPDPEAPSAV